MPAQVSSVKAGALRVAPAGLQRQCIEAGVAAEVLLRCFRWYAAERAAHDLQEGCPACL